ncbi:hypothetical protein D3C86_1847960 [compost metagenome]
MLKPHPRATPYAVDDAKIFESNQYPIDRAIFEYEKKGKGKQIERKQLPIFQDHLHIMCTSSGPVAIPPRQQRSSAWPTAEDRIRFLS